jgi:bifunctional enzyme CysN/CysC
LAIHLADAGVIVIAALISPFRADRAAIAERARERGVPFVEVFVNAPLAECERRDPKQLYKKARAGKIPNFTGIDSPYEVPRWRPILNCTRTGNRSRNRSRS